MKIYLNQFDKQGNLSLKDTIDFSDVSYPLSQLVSIDKCEVEINATKYDGLILVNMKVDVTMTAISSLTNAEGKLHQIYKDNINFSISPDYDNDEYEIVKGNMIDVDYYVYSLIIASFPSRIVFKGEKLDPISSSSFMSEEEYKDKKKERKPSPFDKL